MKKGLLFGLVASAVLFTGCGMSTPKYGMSIENAKKFKQISQASNTKVNVGAFTSSGWNGYTWCRGTEPMETPNGKSYAEYIKDAIDAELTISDLQDTKGLVLTGDLVGLHLASNPINAHWDITMNMSINNDTFVLHHHHRFNAAVNAEEACKQSANAFMDAVQGFVSSLASDPHFIKAMKTKDQTVVSQK